jgi:neutral ceramidase
MMTQLFFAGVAEVDITPPPDLSMDGYLAREGTSLGTHDPLLAQVLIVSDGEKRMALVTLDLLAVSAGFTDPLREALAEKIGTSPAAIMICPSHTHCGPSGLQNWFPPGDRPPLNADLVRMMQERILAAAQTALGSMTAVDLVYAQGAVQGVSGDRNQPHTPVDNPVTALCLQKDNQPVCILFHYACHPTVLGAATRHYSADFVGATRNRLRDQYPGAIPMFLNGALGDISPRYQRRDQSYDEVVRLGNCLADHVIDLLGKTELETDRSFSWDSIPVELPFRTFSLQTALPVVVSGLSRIEETRAQGSAIQATLQQSIGQQATQTATLSLLQIGSWKLFGIPGEPFNRLATSIRAAAPHALVVGLANDYIGYLPTQAAIDFQSYEALSSPFDARALEQLETILIAQLSQSPHQ